ncbi:MAG: hypothetical protein A3F10_07640 [Coxiella sp. RIFCSPHIGHO2_12_FULL_42_15]|nr:MAG: hypothetical protein A3F10_07640 [Coxiella sp. RIFCSPHIGHO2_12_FULL_42_15]
MKKIQLFKCFCFITFSASLITATAFRHWESNEKQLINYHDSGQYYQDISAVIKEATYYLQFRLTQNDRSHNKHKLAIVMDIDETALSNYLALQQTNFNITPEIMRKIQAEDNDPAIPYTLALYNYAKDHGVDIFFITGRNQRIAEHTINNLSTAGYHQWKGIAFNTSDQTKNTRWYRIHERRQIQRAGYDIIMNIGNRKATLEGGYSDMIFKLPNPYYQLS